MYRSVGRSGDDGLVRAVIAVNAEFLEIFEPVGAPSYVRCSGLTIGSCSFWSASILLQKKKCFNIHGQHIKQSEIT